MIGRPVILIGAIAERRDADVVVVGGLDHPRPHLLGAVCTWLARRVDRPGLVVL